jgi:DNA adenine methylase
MAKQKKPIGTEGSREYQLFRYPGGKSKLYQNPAFRALLGTILPTSNTFYEGFVGSAAVTIGVALQFPEKRFIINDLDPTIAGFWELVATGNDAEAQEFERLVTAFSGRLDKVAYFQSLRDAPPVTLVDHAYHALFFNRTTFSGIAMAQPIGGYSQTSKWKIDCRYNAPLLVKKFRRLRELFRNRLTVVHGDCFDWLSRIPEDAPLYLDPPYFVKGDMLYPFAMTRDADGKVNKYFQHVRLAEALSIRHNWIMSYDICPQIEKLYSEFATLLEIPFRYSIDGSKRNWKDKKEYIICRGVDTSRFEQLIAQG